MTIKSHKEFINSLDDANYKSIKEQSDTFAQHLKGYLRTYTDGELHARVIQSAYDEVMELMRQVIETCRNRNPNRLIDLKAKDPSPRQANKASDFDKILTEWRHTRKMIVEEDPKYKMDDESMQTILLKIKLPEYVKDMREQLAQKTHDDCYFNFEQALFVEINTRKMDEESQKRSGRINVLNNSSGEDDKVKHNAAGIEYEEVEIWSGEWQCNICGLPQQRSRSRSRIHGEDDEQDRPTKAPRDQEAAKGDKGKGRGKWPGGFCWMCGGPHFQRECSNLGKGGPPYTITTAWTSWRPGSFPGPSPAQWNPWLPKPYTGKARERAKAEEKEEGATKEKERASFLDLVSIHLGDHHMSTLLLGLEQLPVRVSPTVCNGAECNRRGRARLEDGKRSQRDQRTR